jgi:predicted naringenin-chalcone synthase
MDNIASGLLFADGSAAALITPDDYPVQGLHISDFYSEILSKGKKDMAWELSSNGFLMTLSGYVPDIIEGEFDVLTSRALQKNGRTKNNITHWCIHPGGKRILESIHKSLELTNGELDHSYDILRNFGNMSSATILFVLDKIMQSLDYNRSNTIFGAAFGPGLTMETFVATT